ncbi:Lrp/AsnC family transcriptional regulator [Streptomyces sp. 142MFCol3.1]|uniref:Lrp/AsnC family transcriptional regulator n=1 Tax=Streptomyces sp. 142MFCol3.1 TaxID=1172179 RepID=UPI0004040FF8|nr:Lrp/AsnC family transcriptional regulator [Streptomyces sp. 142MFCol3.1]
MTALPAESDSLLLDLRDQRLLAALQCDGRLGAERAAEVLGLGVRTVQRRWRALLDDGTIRVLAEPPRPAGLGATMLRVRVLRGRLDVIAAALAAREDVPFVDLSATGDEILAVQFTRPATGHRDRLLFRQLPGAQAVTAVTAATVLHVFAEARDWRLDVLASAEREALTPPPVANPTAGTRHADPTDHALLAQLASDARLSATALAARLGLPESTVRRHLAALARTGALRTYVAVDVRRLGLTVDANVLLRVAPGRLDAVGRALAAHPAVHGAVATTGEANLNVAVWFRDLAELYAFLTRDLGALGVDAAETVIVGEAVKRPGATRVVARQS